MMDSGLAEGQGVPISITYSALVGQYRERQAAKPGYNPMEDPAYMRANGALRNIMVADQKLRTPDPADLQTIRDLPGVDSSVEAVGRIVGSILQARHAARTRPRVPTPVYTACKAVFDKYRKKAYVDEGQPGHAEYQRKLKSGDERLTRIGEDRDFFETDLFKTPTHDWCYIRATSAVVKERAELGLPARHLELSELDGIARKLAVIRVAEEDGTPIDPDALAYFTEERFAGDAERVALVMRDRERRPSKPESVADLVS
jgi:hypothetical protein